MALPYSTERLIAELAVQRASLITKKVMPHADQGLQYKPDSSPVTAADLAAQALLISAIHHHFPHDSFVAEESATALRQDAALQKRVWDLVSTAHLDDPTSASLLATPATALEMMDVIDLGSGAGGPRGRVWMLDPVDGTATFLRGEQYAVCLALVEDGEEKVGVLGCPNLALEMGAGVGMGTASVRESTVDREGCGVMLSAVRGQGAVVRRIGPGGLEPARRIERPVDVDGGTEPLAHLRFTDTTLGSSMAFDKHLRIAEALGAAWPGTELWSTQMRYVALTVGGCNIMVRIPRSREKRSFVWDHAGGHLIFEEAGGKMLDLNGKEIYFGAGRRLEDNYGMIAAPLGMHAKLIKMVEELSEL